MLFLESDVKVSDWIMVLECTRANKSKSINLFNAGISIRAAIEGMYPAVDLHIEFSKKVAV